jgi:hypothetical protein
MTIEQILTEADRGGHAKADYRTEFSFRNRLWPRFLDDVDVAIGNAGWRTRSNGQVVIPPGSNFAVLPIEVGRINDLWISRVDGTGGLGGAVSLPSCQQLTYIGEDTAAIADAIERLSGDVSSSDGPRGWWMELLPVRVVGDEPVEGATQNEGWLLNLDWTATVELTIKFTYQIASTLQDDVAFPLSYNMARLIPNDHQYALISLIRSDLLMDRYSDGDPRAQHEYGIYQRFLDTRSRRPGPGPQGHTQVRFR